jgi:hypothetical protein
MRDVATGLPNGLQFLALADDILWADSTDAPITVLSVSLEPEHESHLPPETLVEVAATLKACLRTGDLMFHLEATEFALVLFQMELSASGNVASRLTAELRRLAIPHVSRVSVGAACIPRDSTRLRDVYELAQLRRESASVSSTLTVGA